jgi:hypothetical protein
MLIRSWWPAAVASHHSHRKDKNVSQATLEIEKAELSPEEIDAIMVEGHDMAERGEIFCPYDGEKAQAWWFGVDMAIAEQYDSFIAYREPL